MLGLVLLCVGFSLVASSGDSSPVVVHGLLIVLTFFVVQHGFQGAQASVVAACGPTSRSSPALAHRLNSCGPQA